MEQERIEKAKRIQPIKSNVNRHSGSSIRKEYSTPEISKLGSLAQATQGTSGVEYES